MFYFKSSKNIKVKLLTLGLMASTTAFTITVDGIQSHASAGIIKDSEYVPSSIKSRILDNKPLKDKQLPKIDTSSLEKRKNSTFNLIKTYKEHRGAKDLNSILSEFRKIADERESKYSLKDFKDLIQDTFINKCISIIEKSYQNYDKQILEIKKLDTNKSEKNYTQDNEKILSNLNDSLLDIQFFYDISVELNNYIQQFFNITTEYEGKISLYSLMEKTDLKNKEIKDLSILRKELQSLFGDYQEGIWNVGLNKLSRLGSSWTSSRENMTVNQIIFNVSGTDTESMNSVNEAVIKKLNLQTDAFDSFSNLFKILEISVEREIDGSIKNKIENKKNEEITNLEKNNLNSEDLNILVNYVDNKLNEEGGCNVTPSDENSGGCKVSDLLLQKMDSLDKEKAPIPEIKDENIQMLTLSGVGDQLNDIKKIEDKEIQILPLSGRSNQSNDIKEIKDENINLLILSGMGDQLNDIKEIEDKEIQILPLSGRSNQSNDIKKIEDEKIEILPLSGRSNQSNDIKKIEDEEIEILPLSGRSNQSNDIKKIEDEKIEILPLSGRSNQSNDIKKIEDEKIEILPLPNEDNQADGIQVENNEDQGWWHIFDELDQPNPAEVAPNQILVDGANVNDQSIVQEVIQAEGAPDPAPVNASNVGDQPIVQEVVQAEVIPNPVPVNDANVSDQPVVQEIVQAEIIPNPVPVHNEADNPIFPEKIIQFEDILPNPIQVYVSNKDDPTIFPEIKDVPNPILVNDVLQGDTPDMKDEALNVRGHDIQVNPEEIKRQDEIVQPMPDNQNNPPKRPSIDVIQPLDSFSPIHAVFHHSDGRNWSPSLEQVMQPGYDNHGLDRSSLPKIQRVFEPSDTKYTGIIHLPKCLVKNLLQRGGGKISHLTQTTGAKTQLNINTRAKSSDTQTIYSPNTGHSEWSKRIQGAHEKHGLTLPSSLTSEMYQRRVVETFTSMISWAKKSNLSLNEHEKQQLFERACYAHTRLPEIMSRYLGTMTPLEAYDKAHRIAIIESSLWMGQNHSNVSPTFIGGRGVVILNEHKEALEPKIRQDIAARYPHLTQQMAAHVAEQHIKVQELLGKPVNIAEFLIEKVNHMDNIKEYMTTHESTEKLQESLQQAPQDINGLRKPETHESVMITLQREIMDHPDRTPPLEVALSKALEKKREFEQQHNIQEQHV